MIYECEDIARTIDDHIDEFENLGFLIQEKNGFLKTTARQFNCSDSY